MDKSDIDGNAEPQPEVSDFNAGKKVQGQTKVSKKKQQTPDFKMEKKKKQESKKQQAKDSGKDSGGDKSSSSNAKFESWRNFSNVGAHYKKNGVSYQQVKKEENENIKNLIGHSLDSEQEEAS